MENKIITKDKLKFFLNGVQLMYINLVPQNLESKKEIKIQYDEYSLSKSFKVKITTFWEKDSDIYAEKQKYAFFKKDFDKVLELLNEKIKDLEVLSVFRNGKYTYHKDGFWNDN